ncbi:hypothetical protein L596_000551 [Steinernema carpocapsae]|uniref:Domain of unknown function DB domain-containing protein n=1 Tax=Steinernema carpocapsae TaxID=34508 RepID=A0A4U8UMP1_STECR|nr:hypothetical protein L596_000551 [Steinernema carpocapsae]
MQKTLQSQRKNNNFDRRKVQTRFHRSRPRSISFFLNMCTSRGSTVKDMWDCASTHYDHTECCRRNHVIPECLRYCKADDPVTTDYKYLFCIQSFNGIRDCFRSHLDTHANIFGDN